MTLHTNIGGTWKEISQPSVNIGGTWKSCSGVYVNIGGTWKTVWESGGGYTWPDEDGYIYKAGSYADEWVEGIDTGDGTRSKESGYLQLATTARYDDIAWVTDSTIDLTDYTYLKVDCEGSATGTNYLDINVSTVKMGDLNTYNAQVFKATTFSRQTLSLAISSLNSSYYIRLHGEGYNAVFPAATFKIYNVWLE